MYILPFDCSNVKYSKILNFTHAYMHPYTILDCSAFLNFCDYNYHYIELDCCLLLFPLIKLIKFVILMVSLMMELIALHVLSGTLKW